MSAENCVWPVDWRCSIPEIGRVYLGDEGCPLFLANPEFLFAIQRLLDAEKSVTLVVPLLLPEWFRAFERLLGQIPPEVEIAVNDFGAFAAVCESGRTPVIGRLLSRQTTDPTIVLFRRPTEALNVFSGANPVRLEHIPPPEPLWEHWRTPPVFSGPFLRYLRGMTGGRVIRLEVDLPPHGLTETAPEALVSVHTAETLLAVQGCRDCRSCPQTAVSCGKTRAGDMVFRRRNVFFLRCKTSQTELPAYADRAVERREK